MKVTRKEPKFTTSGTNNSTAGVTIDAKLTAGYNDRIVNTAIQLKANYGSKYSDEYYLDAASSWYKEELGAAFKAAYSKNTSKCPIKDSKWAGYSYEEIIQMENSGVKIPQEVLLWAHAQQESDVTAYEVISTTSAIDDNSSTEELVGDFDLNSLQTKAKQSIMKATEAEKNTQSVTEEYNKNKGRALEIKKENNNSYQKSMNEISNLTNEWKKLDKKAKSGQLSEAEQSRYQELSKMLGNKSSSSMKEIEVNSKELDNLLSSMNLLETKVTENETIADDAVQAGKDLSNLNKNYHEMQQTHPTSGVVYSNMGLLSDVLYGITGSSIEKIAIETGKDLTETSNNEIAELHSSADITMFANAYTSNVVETKQATVVAQNTEEENKTDNTEKTAENNNPAVDNNKTENTNNIEDNTSTNEEDSKDLSLEFTYQNARKATEVTEQTTNDIIKGQENTDKTNKDLQKQSIKSQKDVQKVNQEVAKAGMNELKNITQAVGATTELAISNVSVVGEVVGEVAKTVGANVQGLIPNPKNLVPNNPSQKNDDQNNNQENQNTLDPSFSFANAVRSTIQTLSATQDLNIAASNLDKKDSKVEQQNKKSQGLVKSIEKDAAKTLSIQEEDDKKTENSVSATVQSIANPVSAQNDDTAGLEKSINNNIRQLNVFKKDSTSLNNLISSHEKSNSNLIDVSTNAVVVGLGTRVLGAAHAGIGSLLITEGAVLLPNPATHAVGVAKTVIGTGLVKQGTLETVGGVTSQLTGEAALLTSGVAKATTTVAKSIMKTSKSEQKDADKRIKAATKELTNKKRRTRTFSFNLNNKNSSNKTKTSTSSTENQDVQIQAQQNDNQQQPIQMQSQQELNTQSAIAFNTPEENENKVIDTEKIANQTALETAIVENNTQSGEFTNDPTLLGASATTNAEVKSNTQTDDKADRKLSRFNMDSIIESKKKRKKVQGVSASSKG